MTKIGAAIIGCGKVADTHARALSTLPESRLVAVHDHREERAVAMAARYGARPYTDLDAQQGMIRDALDMIVNLGFALFMIAIMLVAIFARDLPLPLRQPGEQSRLWPDMPINRHSPFSLNRSAISKSLPAGRRLCHPSIRMSAYARLMDRRLFLKRVSVIRPKRA